MWSSAGCVPIPSVVESRLSDRLCPPRSRRFRARQILARTGRAIVRRYLIEPMNKRLGRNMGFTALINNMRPQRGRDPRPRPATCIGQNSSTPKRAEAVLVTGTHAAVAHNCSALTELRAGVADDLQRGVEEQDGYSRSDDDVRPGAIQPQNEPGSDDDGDIRQRIIT